MRPQLLFGFAVSLVGVALGSTDDIENIRTIIADFAFYSDDKNFPAIGSLFVPNATYDPGNGNVEGVPAIEAKLSSILAPGTVTSIAVLQSRIVLGPPFDAIGAAGTATALTASEVVYFGQGKLKGQVLSIPARFTDKLVKTGDFAKYGGWRFASRVFRVQVSFILFFSFVFFLLF